MKSQDAVVIAGGYGVVGEQAAHIIRQRHPALPLFLAGRNPEKGEVLARTLANAQSLKLDIQRDKPLNGLMPRAIIGLVNDPVNHLMLDAVDKGIPYLDITRWTEQVRTTIFDLSGRQLRAPVVLSSGWMAGVAAILAVAASRQLASVERIDIGVLYSLRDKSGPNSVEYMDRLATPFNVMLNGAWTSVFPLTDSRHLTFPGGYSAKVYRFDTPDHVTLPAATGAHTVSARIAFDNMAATRALVWLTRSGMWKLMSGPRFTRLRHALLHNPGPGASHELVVEVSGNDACHVPKTVRVTLADPQGQTHLTALGIAIQLERLLGLDGIPALAPGITYPDTAPHLDSALDLLRSFNVTITMSDV